MKIKQWAHDSRKKSILKTISWRFIAVVTSIAIIYIYTRELAMSTEIALLASVISTIQYYIHERLWKKYEI